MQVIEAVLAFAVTLLVLSLVVSTLVETIHRIFGLREAGLRYILGQFFDQVLKDYLPAASNLRTDAEKAAFQERISANRAPIGLKQGPDPALATRVAAVPAAPPEPAKEPGLLWGGKQLTKLSAAEFMERIGSDKLGATLIANIKATARERVLEDVTRKYEAFGKEASSYFEGRARFMAVIVAFVVAFALHVNAIELFQTFLRDPAVRARVINQSDKTQEAYKAAEAEAAKKAPATDTAKREWEAVKEQYENALKKLQVTETQLRDLGVPIGWTEERVRKTNAWPGIWNCQDPSGNWVWDWSLSGKCGDQNKMYVWVYLPRTIDSILGLLLGGLLIGLGGPFWYDFVRGLTNIRDLARSVTGAAEEKPAPAPAPAPTPAPRPPAPVMAPARKKGVAALAAMPAPVVVTPVVAAPAEAAPPRPPTPADIFNVAFDATVPRARR